MTATTLCERHGREDCPVCKPTLSQDVRKHEPYAHRKEVMKWLEEIDYRHYQLEERVAIIQTRLYELSDIDELVARQDVRISRLEDALSEYNTEVVENTLEPRGPHD